MLSARYWDALIMKTHSQWMQNNYGRAPQRAALWPAMFAPLLAHGMAQMCTKSGLSLPRSKCRYGFLIYETALAQLPVLKIW
jgi:hypothetical protein